MVSACTGYWRSYAHTIAKCGHTSKYSMRGISRARETGCRFEGESEIGLHFLYMHPHRNRAGGEQLFKLMRRFCTFLLISCVVLAFNSCEKMGGLSANGPDYALTSNLMLGNSAILDDDYLWWVGLEKNYSLVCGYVTSWTYKYGTTAGPVPSDLCEAGSGRGLGSLNTSSVPTSGWHRSVAIEKHHLYILRFPCADDYAYFGLYVEDSILNTNDGIMGYKIKTARFTPGSGWD